MKPAAIAPIKGPKNSTKIIPILPFNLIAPIIFRKNLLIGFNTVK